MFDVAGAGGGCIHGNMQTQVTLILVVNTTILGCPATSLFKLSAKGSIGTLQGTIKWSLGY